VAGKTLMVIGGSGFFGKSILDAHRRGLLRPWETSRIIVVARNAGALRQSYPDLIGDDVQLLNADIGEARDLPPADYVIHAASTTDARRYIDAPREERRNILRSIDNYCDIARATHRHCKILYTSSGAVYGQLPSDLLAVTEDHVPAEVGGLVAYKRDYAEAKLAAERRLARLGTEGLRVSVARCFAFVGAYLPRDQHFAIGNFIEDGLHGREIRVNAQKAVYRSYMHADDLVRWLMTIADHADGECPIYNVGSDDGRTVADVASLVARKFGVEVSIPAITSDEVDRYVPSTMKAHRQLGLKLEFDLETALDDVIERVASRSA
jgi:dTDP-glucose 4,6-dehydratase